MNNTNKYLPIQKAKKSNPSVWFGLNKSVVSILQNWCIFYPFYLKINPKGTVDVISSDPFFLERNVRFTTVFFKPWDDQG